MVNLKSRILALTVLSLSLACETKKSDLGSLTPLPELGGGSQINCFLDEQDTFSLGTNPSVDFISENTPISARVTATNCSGVSVGQVSSGQLKYLSRNGATLTFAKTTSIVGYTLALFDLQLSGTSIVPMTSTSCSSGHMITENITSGSVNSGLNQLILNIRTTINSTGCATTLPNTLYEHTAIKGFWQKACDLTKRSFVSFYRNAGIYTTTHYANSGCTTPNFYIERNGPYTVRNSSAGNHQVDFGFQKYFVYLYNSATVNSFNSASMCGISNWTQGVDRDVSGRFCDFASIGAGPSETFPVRNSHFELIQITGNTLYLGDPNSGNGTTSSLRPTSVLNQPFTKDPGLIAIPVWAGPP